MMIDVDRKMMMIVYLHRLALGRPSSGAASGSDLRAGSTLAAAVISGVTMPASLETTTGATICSGGFDPLKKDL